MLVAVQASRYWIICCISDTRHWYIMYIYLCIYIFFFLQFFDAVGWTWGADTMSVKQKPTQPLGFHVLLWVQEGHLAQENQWLYISNCEMHQKPVCIVLTDTRIDVASHGQKAFVFPPPKKKYDVQSSQCPIYVILNQKIVQQYHKQTKTVLCVCYYCQPPTQKRKKSSILSSVFCCWSH